LDSVRVSFCLKRSSRNMRNVQYWRMSLCAWKIWTLRILIFYLRAFFRVLLQDALWHWIRIPRCISMIWWAKRNSSPLISASKCHWEKHLYSMLHLIQTVEGKECFRILFLIKLNSKEPNIIEILQIHNFLFLSKGYMCSQIAGTSKSGN